MGFNNDNGKGISLGRLIDEYYKEFFALSDRELLNFYLRINLFIDASIIFLTYLLLIRSLTLVFFFG